jgi:penicillin-binding protein 2
MKVSRVSAIVSGLLAWSMGALSAGALDAPQKIHRSRTAEPRLSESHRSAAHHAASASSAHASTAHVTHVLSAHSAVHPTAGTAAHLRRTSLHSRHPYYQRTYASSLLAGPVGAGDITVGEDPVIRQAAIDALGDINGTAVVIDPSSGRILAMVNQKLALSPGAEPCSTIKLTVAMAALSEGLVTRDTMVKLDGFRMNMTQAIAHSNNLYFEELGRELGFERVRHYATEFGLGELAGYDIPGEQLGTYPDQEIPAADGGVARMCSFGQGVSLTPLQLGAYVSALANGGTLYYLQHPTTPEEIAAFQPRVKRTLDIGRYVPDMVDGMAGAVEFGTARRLRVNFQQFPVFGKTGTCSNDGTHLGWFVSYSDSPQGSLVTVFFLEGGRDVFGPRAAELTGEFYKNLWDRNYFGNRNQEAQSDSGASPASPAGATQ